MTEDHTAAIEEQRAAHERMTVAIDAIDKLVTASDVTEEQRTAASDAFDAAEKDFEAATRSVEEHEKAEQRAKSVELARKQIPRDLPVADPKSRATDRADLPYSPDGHSFYSDLIKARDMVPGIAAEAYERLAKNNQHRIETMPAKQRAGLTQAATAGGEFIYPVWLDEYVPLLRAGRVFANLCGPRPLPANTNSINVPKITTGASVAAQLDAGTVSNTDLVTTSVTAQVQTIAGRTVAAYQDIDLGQGYIDQMIHDDLMAAYDAQEDTLLINGAVTNAKGILNVTGTNAVTYTDATPTGPELYVPLFQAKSQIGKLAFVEANAMLMHPSTWNWYLAQLDTSNLPLAIFAGNDNFNRTATFTQANQGLAGQVAGIPVYVDANMPVNLGAGTNQAPIVMFNNHDLFLFESTPSFKVADQTSIVTLQYQFVLYGYAAWAFGRLPAMVSIINGTGLIVQAGY